MRDQALVLGRVDRVQRFVLASPRLQQIRGGSALLVEMENDARELLGSQQTMAAGGMVLAQVAAQDADRLSRTLRLRYALRAPGARFRAVHVPVDPDRFGESLDAALGLLARAPDGMEPPPDIPFVLPCDLCRVRPARVRLPAPGGERPPRACLDCRARFGAHDRLRGYLRGEPVPDRYWTGIADVFQKLGSRVADPDVEERPARVVQDLSRGRPRGYVGYLAADGNGVGDRVRGLQALDEYRAFASQLDAATGDALCAAADTCRAGPASLLPVVAGGDDLLLFCAPALAVPVAVEFAREFERRTAGPEGASARVGTGIGVVIAHATTPFGVLDERAHELQKRAKAMARRAGGASAIGFAILRGGEDVEPPQVLDRHLGVGTYLVDDAGAELDAGRLVRHAQAISAARPPWSRLKRVPEVLSLPDPRATIEYELLLRPLAPTLRETLGRAAAPPTGYSAAAEGPWIVNDETGRFATGVPDALALAEIL